MIKASEIVLFQKGGYLYSTLKRKTPLKAKTTLKAKSTLKARTGLRTYKPLRATKSMDKTSSTECKAKKPSKPKQKAYKPKYPYASIFTDDLKTCYITGSTKDTADIHIHHVFGGASNNKANSEKYHFLIPLRADWHDMADYGIHFNRELDLKIKRYCQDYWLEHYGTKEEFIAVFSKWW